MEYRDTEDGWTSMCFHLENQSTHVNRIVSLVRASRNGKSYIGVFSESIKEEAVLKLLRVETL